MSAPTYDYAELVRVLPELAIHIKHGNLDYADPEAVRLLNRALFRKELGLEVNLPRGHLCPTVPNRLAYICAIERTLHRLFALPRDCPVMGVDIGTGASCVYPLIGCSRNPSWSFLATEIDEDSLVAARHNVTANPHLSKRINLLHNGTPTVIFPPVLVEALSTASHHNACRFAMCNPPFYASETDMNIRRAAKRHRPHTPNGEMSTSEAVCRFGGEQGFVRRMIDESRQLSSLNFILFSSLLGLRESLDTTLVHLQQTQQSVSVLSFAYEPLTIAHTTRWIVFWSFSHSIPADSKHRLLIPPHASKTQTIEVPADLDLAAFCTRQLGANCIVKEELDGIIPAGPPVSPVPSVSSDSQLHTTRLFITHNTWSRRARRGAPETLSTPLRVTVHKTAETLVFELENKEKESWDVFVGLVNHLRGVSRDGSSQ